MAVGVVYGLNRNRNEASNRQPTIFEPESSSTLVIEAEEYPAGSLLNSFKRRN